MIISTAIPQITDDFASVTDIGWYGSAYLLATCAFQLMYGKLFTFYSIKAVFLSAVLLFEIGSALCGAAPSSIAFIVGRAIAGLGAAGIFSGAVRCLTRLTRPVPCLPRACRAVPFLSLTLTQPFCVRGADQRLPLRSSSSSTRSRCTRGRCTRACSVPCSAWPRSSALSWAAPSPQTYRGGGASTSTCRIPYREETHQSTWKKLSQLDGVGTTVFVPGTICLILALTWGGLDYPVSRYAPVQVRLTRASFLTQRQWNEGRIIALLVVAGVLLASFVVVQILMPNTATVPPRIFMQRSIMAGFWATFCLGSAMMIFGRSSKKILVCAGCETDRWQSTSSPSGFRRSRASRPSSLA